MYSHRDLMIQIGHTGPVCTVQSYACMTGNCVVVRANLSVCLKCIPQCKPQCIPQCKPQCVPQCKLQCILQCMLAIMPNYCF